MNRLDIKRANSDNRARRSRSSISGTSSRPRLSIFISNRRVYAQIIDDEKQHTILSISSNAKDKKSMTDLARDVGAELSKKAKSKKVKQVVLDRGSKKYHGRVKALAEAAREGGLDF